MPSIIRATTTSGLQVAPDNSGSLQLQTNGTTAAVTIDASQNVGIGTASTNFRGSAGGKFLAVAGSSVTGGVLELVNTDADAANNYSTITFIADGNTLTARKSIAQVEAYTVGTTAGNRGGNLSFVTKADNGIAAEQMVLNSSGNLQFNSGYGSVATAYGCRAWVNFNGTGVVAIRASGNVSSITDNGVGDFTVNFTTAMPNVNFCANITATGPIATQHCVPFIGSPGSNDTSGFPNTSSFRFSQYNVTNSGSRADAVVLCVSIFR